MLVCCLNDDFCYDFTLKVCLYLVSLAVLQAILSVSNYPLSASLLTFLHAHHSLLSFMILWILSHNIIAWSICWLFLSAKVFDLGKEYSWNPSGLIRLLIIGKGVVIIRITQKTMWIWLWNWDCQMINHNLSNTLGLIGPSRPINQPSSASMLLTHRYNSYTDLINYCEVWKQNILPSSYEFLLKFIIHCVKYHRGLIMKVTWGIILHDFLLKKWYYANKMV